MLNEEEIRQEYELIAQDDEVLVEVKARKHGSTYLPDKGGEFVMWARFRRMQVEDMWMIERFTERTEYVDKHPVVDHDNEETKRQLLRFQLLDWSMDIPLEFDEAGRLSERCWRVVMKQPAPLIDAFITKYQQTYWVTVDDEKDIQRQCSILFGKNSRGVDNACEAVTLYCVLSSMWDKFGINWFDIKKLPYKQYVMLRMVVAQEIDARKAQMNASKRQNATRIAGRGGRTRPSRGVTIGQ